VTSVLLAVELLLFEWKPRRMILVAPCERDRRRGPRYIIGLGRIFPAPPHPLEIPFIREVMGPDVVACRRTSRAADGALLGGAHRQRLHLSA
jgi:hypothetical protein